MLNVVDFHIELIVIKKLNWVQPFDVVQVDNHMLHKLYHDDIYKKKKTNKNIENQMKIFYLIRYARTIDDDREIPI